MTVDLAAAAQFIAGHARLLERRRFGFLESDGSAETVVAALRAYINDDGGIGHLEPDLRTPASQPSAMLYALEVLNEVGAHDDALTTGALDWLRREATNDDGGVPFALPSARGWPHAPWFDPQDDPPSSLLMTAALAAQAHRLGLDHPWLAPATAFCWEHGGGAAATAPDPYTLRLLVDFFDAVPDRARADAALAALTPHIPADGLIAVGAGAEGELLRPLDLAPRPGHAARRLFADDVIERELDTLAAGQADDGGWTFTWAAWNPAAAWEWRGVVTMVALCTLRAYGRL
jgi:hypothetical protein